MKKIIFSLILVVMSTAAFAQTPDKIFVGPYELNYYGKGDFEYMLRDSVDLYDYYELERPTEVVQQPVEKTEPMKHGMQVGLGMRLPFGSPRAAVIGVEGVWKQGLGKNFYLNAGLGLNYVPVAKKAGVEIGIPVSIEYTNLDRKKTALYVGAGIVPAYYTSAKAFDVAPRVDFGGYLPLFNQLFRIGVYGQFNTNREVGALFTKRGLSVGGNLGIVF